MAKIQVTSANSNLPFNSNRTVFRSLSGSPSYGIPTILVRDTNTSMSVRKGNSAEPTSFSTAGTLTNGTIITALNGAMDSNNILHIVWLNNAAAVSKVMYVTFNCNTDTFSTPVTVVNDIGEAPATDNLYSAIAVDANNVPHIMYSKLPKIGGVNSYILAYRNRIGGSWGTEILLNNTKDYHCSNFSIAIGIDNIPVLAYSVQGLSAHTLFALIGNANNLTSVTAFVVTSSAPSPIKYSLAIRDNGNVIIAEIGQTYPDRIYINHHAYSAPWTTWTTYYNASNTAFSLSATANNNTLYVFFEGTADNDIKYFSCDLDTQQFSDTSVLETGTFNTALVKWALWHENDSLGSLSSQNNQMVHGTNSSWSALYGVGTSNAYEKQSVQIYTNTRGGKYNNIRLAINKLGAPTDSLIVKVYSGSFEGTLIATSNAVSGSPLTTTSQLINFQFDSEFTLEGSTTYYITIERTGTYDTTNYYFINGGSTNLNTNNVRYRRNSGTWTAVTDYDTMIFFGDQILKEIDYLFFDETATPDIWWNTLSLAAAAIWTTKSLKWYNGASWVEKPLKYHNGSTWVTKPVKINM